MSKSVVNCPEIKSGGWGRLEKFKDVKMRKNFIYKITDNFPKSTRLTTQFAYEVPTYDWK